MQQDTESCRASGRPVLHAGKATRQLCAQHRPGVPAAIELIWGRAAWHCAHPDIVLDAVRTLRTYFAEGRMWVRAMQPSSPCCAHHMES